MLIYDEVADAVLFISEYLYSYHLFWELISE